MLNRSKCSGIPQSSRGIAAISSFRDLTFEWSVPSAVFPFFIEVNNSLYGETYVPVVGGEIGEVEEEAVLYVAIIA